MCDSRISDLRWRKYQKEQDHIQKLLEKGFHPIEIADRLIHLVLQTMAEGYKNDHPHLTETEILSKMRTQLAFYKRLKRVYH